MFNEENVLPKLNPENNIKTNSNIWYLDNGASNHMTRCHEKFSVLGEQVTGQVRFGDGSTVNIERKGTINFKCGNGEDRALREVYYIPTLVTIL